MHAATWWPDAVAILQAAAAIPRNEFQHCLENLIFSYPDVRPALERTRADTRPNLELGDVVRLVADERGYIRPIIQDVVLETFTASEFARAIDRRADAFRTDQRPDVFRTSSGGDRLDDSSALPPGGPQAGSNDSRLDDARPVQPGSDRSRDGAFDVLLAGNAQAGHHDSNGYDHDAMTPASRQADVSASAPADAPPMQAGSADRRLDDARPAQSSSERSRDGAFDVLLAGSSQAGLHDSRSYDHDALTPASRQADVSASDPRPTQPDALPTQATSDDGADDSHDALTARRTQAGSNRSRSATSTTGRQAAHRHTRRAPNAPTRARRLPEPQRPTRTGPIVSRHARRAHDDNHNTQEMQAAGIGASLLGIQPVRAQAPLLERLFAPPPSDARTDTTNDDDNQSPTQPPRSPAPPPPVPPQERHPVARPLPNGWSHLVDVQLPLEYKRHCNTLKTIPYAIRHDYTRLLSSVVHNLDFTYRTTDERNHPHRVRAWKLFCLLSRLLLFPLQRGGRAGNKELKERVRLFDEGHWGELLLASRNSTPIRRRPATQSQEQELEKTIANARRLISNGELNHAARLLRSKGVAPGTLETLTQLTGPRLRPSTQLRPIPDEILSYRPEAAVELDRDLFAKNLRTTRRGLSPGLGGTRNEHLKLALEDSTCLEDLTNVAQHVAEGDLPQQVAEAMRMCKLTAVTKNETKIRGLNAGDSFRRLVARTLAQQHTDEFQNATKPYNFGMSVSSGTDAVIHFIRSLTDTHPDLVLTKIDGVGAFDHIYRSVMLQKLRTLPTARKLLPFVLMSYGATSTYVWTDENGIAHDIHQAEGGEQGDALMPALFCLGLHDALAAADRQLLPGEYLVAYLDDIYLLTTRPRARDASDVVTSHIREHTGIEPNLNKTECWCTGGGPAPPGVAELGVPDQQDVVTPVWKGDLADEYRGVEVLSSPLGTNAYAQKCMNERMARERKLLEKLNKIGHLQEE